jgi:hypothetical protein
MRRVAAWCLLGVAFNALVFGPSLELTATGNNDFMSVYSGTRLAFTDGMYDLGQNLRVQRESAGWENVNHLFMRPPFVALLLWPLGQLPYVMASHVWAILTLAMVGLFCRFWPGDRKLAALACCWSLPLFHVFANGQDVAILLVVMALALGEMRRGRDTVAGLIFSLCGIKFHLFLLLPLLILGQKRWRFLGGLASGGAFLFLLSFVPGGWHWPAKYAAFLRNPIGNPWRGAMPNLHGLTNGMVHAEIWQAGGVVMVALLTWIAVRRSGFEYGLAMVLAGGILVAPHAYLSDCALAVPALLITLPMAGGAWQRAFHWWLLLPALPLFVLFGQAWVMAVGLIAYLAFTAAQYTKGIYPFTNHPMLVRMASEHLTSN